MTGPIKTDNALRQSLTDLGFRGPKGGDLTVLPFQEVATPLGTARAHIIPICGLSVEARRYCQAFERVTGMRPVIKVLPDSTANLVIHDVAIRMLSTEQIGEIETVMKETEASPAPAQHLRF